jgi:CYTH domain-containing protein
MPLEIERKFLIAGPPDPSHPVLRNADLVNYEQIYLHVDDIEQRRIRRGISRGSTTYQIAHMRQLTTGVREVSERRIARAEYERLRDRRDPTRQIIYKDRRRFSWDGRLLELDEIFEPRSRACHLLEIQVDDLAARIALPDFLSVDREVTGEPRYANSMIALG